MSEPVIESTLDTATTPEITLEATPTQPQAVTVDMEALSRIAEKKAEKVSQSVVKEILTKQGLDDETIKNVLADFKSRQPDPKQEIENYKTTIGQLQTQIETEQREKIAMLKGVPLNSDDDAVKEKANACMTLAKSYISESVPFEVALDRALQVISFADKKEDINIPKFDGGAGREPITQKDVKGMSYMDRLKLKNPQMHAEYKPKTK